MKYQKRLIFLMKAYVWCCALLALYVSLYVAGLGAGGPGPVYIPIIIGIGFFSGLLAVAIGLYTWVAHTIRKHGKSRVWPVWLYCALSFFSFPIGTLISLLMIYSAYKWVYEDDD